MNKNIKELIINDDDLTDRIEKRKKSNINRWVNIRFEKEANKISLKSAK